MPYFYHPDMKSQYFHFQYLAKGHFNIYQYISDNKSNLPYRDTFNYLPLTYLTFGTISAILTTLLPSDYATWINDWSADQNKYANFPYFLLILKIPYLIFDILIGYLLYKISRSIFIFKLWIFNPLSFYLIYILGNFDVLPAFLTILSLYLLNSKPKYSFLIFGLAIALKLYPLIFLPFYMLTVTRKPLQIIKYSFLALLPIIITILPFASNSTFWSSFLGSGLTQKILELKYLGFSVYPIIYFIILIFALFSKKLDLPKYIFYLFLLFISTVHFHPQWLLWFLPFIFLLKHKFTKDVLLLLLLQVLIIIYILLFNDNYLFWGHLIPIDPEFVNLTSPYTIIRYKFLVNPDNVQNNIHLLICIFSIITFASYEKSIRHTNN